MLYVQECDRISAVKVITEMLRSVFAAACVAGAAAFAPAALPTATHRASAASGMARAHPLFPGVIALWWI